MDRRPKSDSYRKAVLTAQNIIKSRTGNAIMKQAYKTADRQAEKKARLIDHRKGKELRKLAHEKVQFINEQDEKLKRKDLSKTRAAKHNDTGAQPVVVEIRIPSEKDFVAVEEHCDEIPEAVRSPRTARSSLMRGKLNAEKRKDVCSAAQTKNQSNEIFTTQIEDYEFTENGEFVLAVKTIRDFNEEAKRGRLPESEIEVRTTNFYQNHDQITSWLNDVERDNLGHFQRTPKSSRRKNKKGAEDGEVPTKDKENSELKNTCKSAKGKLANDKGFLKLPRITYKPESPVSSRTKSFKRMDSLEDPRFTKLLNTLTPVKGTLKLPKIPRSAESKSRAS
ncbi:hypothetical protein OS493_025662 [Desmophyllum pertusum]|uniref:Uncharacterized protein n=1 Tax=Desmophyllum pertusum TaxID=174260 RepID=A0A9X0D878_9CNID|nr:hypothetical protein OS493_025662 [Desmophyllum pertusum]